MEKILLFLLVNEKCYPSQLRRILNTPLTPLQKALERLEKGGIVTSSYEGKTRLYALNPHYALIGELEMLLKKAYGLLSAEEKKHYYFVKESSKNKMKSQEKVLLDLFERMKNVSEVTFEAKSHSKASVGWKGRGKGEVIVSYDGASTLIFQEEGVRTLDGTDAFNFSNSFRWTLHRIDCLLGLEHLRFGPKAPYFMFHLRPTGKNCLESIHSHLCKEDTYFGSIHFDEHTIHLNWRIIGPKKNEELEYIYR